jgi:hypothetical protein
MLLWLLKRIESNWMQTIPTIAYVSVSAINDAHSRGLDVYMGQKTMQ